jgi:predicted DNA-binding transcriptional regulator AlpA
MRVADVADYTKVAIRTIWSHAAKGTFPPPISIGRAKRWLRTDVDAWIVEQRAKVRQKP